LAAKLASEWCSDNHDRFAATSDPNWGDRPNALPFIADDFSFAFATGRRIRNINAMPDSDITFTCLCFRQQKNNYNGQSLAYGLALDVPHAG
jgi:hypothetical protein